MSLEEVSRSARDSARKRVARRYGYLPPRREKDCPPRPKYCECCGKFAKLHLDHCHETGAFRGWVCNPCNTGTGIIDDIELLERRIAFLRKYEKKKERIDLIREVHESMLLP
jgi:hypothetical protein